jgi:hypothetical protein
VVLLSMFADAIELAAEFCRPRGCAGRTGGSLAENVPITGDEVR